MVGIASDGIPYPLFALCGMVMWTYFSSTLREAVESLTSYTGILTKIYFPRLILPLSSVLAKLVDLAVISLLFIPVMLWYRVTPRIEAVVVVPSLILVLILATLGLALWLSALAVQYRDVSHSLAFCIQALMYFSPVVYSDSMVPARFRIIYGLNPVAGVIGGVRAAVLGTGGNALGLDHPRHRRGRIAHAVSRQPSTSAAANALFCRRGLTVHRRPNHRRCPAGTVRSAR